jgi:hypothetical protein
MLRWFHQRMMERFEAAVAPHQTAYDRILALLRAKITFATEYADLIRVFHSLMFLPEELRPRFNPMPFWEQRFGLILEVVREGVASGELRGDPMDISFVISGSFWTLAATQALFPALPVLQPGLDERLWDVIYHGVRGR